MISLGGLIHALVLLVIGGLVVWLCWWLIAYIGLPAPFDKVARVVIAVGAFLVCVGALLSLAGYQVFAP